jgi:hypothetical protein
MIEDRRGCKPFAFGNLAWPTPGTLRLRGSVPFCFRFALRATLQQNGASILEGLVFALLAQCSAEAVRLRSGRDDVSLIGKPVEHGLAILTLASQYGRYGYRRITALLKRAGWPVGKGRVERIWRHEGLKVPQKQKPKGRLWLNDGSCVRLRPEHVNHVWSYDFVSAKTHDERTALGRSSRDWNM